MCGIAGLIGPGADSETVERLAALLKHRGPDDTGVWSEPGAALAHTRLSILDLSAAGHQPMQLGPLTIVYNGEIYNYRELRAELRGPFTSNSDTEVLLHLYREHGDRCVEKLRGMFAFAIWDASRRRLFAARDHLGIKPLHYSVNRGTLALASEVGPMKSVCGGTIDRTAIVDYLTYGYIPTPKTIYTGIHKLPPAHTLVFEDGKLRLERYWNPVVESSIDDMALAVEQLDDLLREIVPSQLVSDVPIGVFLSGGLDSATVTFYAGKVSTFTLGLDDPAKSEADAARRLAAHLGTTHHEIMASSGGLRPAVDTVARCFGEPFGDNGAWSSFLISKLARQHVTVALSGEGGDELFGGYKRYWKAERRSPWPLRHLLRRLASPTGRLGRSLLRQTETGMAAAAARTGGVVEATLNALLDPTLIDPGYDRLWSLRPFWRDDLDPVLRLRWLDLNTALPDRLLTKVDRTSMAHSLEVRPPLLDHRLVEFAFRLSPRLLVDVRAARGKLVVRRLMNDRLPPDHLARPKRGFGVPIKRWLAQDQDLIATASRTLMDAKILRRPVDHHFDRAWQLLVLARWLEVNA